MSGSERIPIEGVVARAYEVPTDRPEADGTLDWDSTTLVVAEVKAGGRVGLGYTYGHAASAGLIRAELAQALAGRDALDIPGAWLDLSAAVRNVGRPGLASMAVSAVDTALWDLKGRLLDLPVVRLLGRARDSAPVCGSGGFTSYSLDQLQAQLAGWVEQGIRRVKMKVGRDPAADAARVRAARAVVGPDVELFVDGDGAYTRKEALALAFAFAEQEVRWFEEPVSSDDLEGLSLLRDRVPPPVQVTAGEYGFDLPYFRRMLAAGAVDVLMADATRCGGLTGFLGVAALCQAWSLPLSAHCAPALHVHVACASPPVRHLEYFHDHARLEPMLFDGAPSPVGGRLAPDLSRPGLGLELKRADAERWAVA